MAKPDQTVEAIFFDRVVRIVREHKSQAAAARAIGCVPATLNRYLRGHNFPTKHLAKKVDHEYFKIIAYEKKRFSFNPKAYKFKANEIRCKHCGRHTDLDEALFKTTSLRICGEVAEAVRAGKVQANNYGVQVSFKEWDTCENVDQLPESGSSHDGAFDEGSGI